jgi:hypothetical protein
MRAAWEKYKAMPEYEISRRWALRTAPMFQAGESPGDKVCELLPLEQRKLYADGALWAAFVAGWEAALKPPLPAPPRDAGTEEASA